MQGGADLVFRGAISLMRPRALDDRSSGQVADEVACSSRMACCSSAGSKMLPAKTAAQGALTRFRAGVRLPGWFPADWRTSAARAFSGSDWLLTGSSCSVHLVFLPP